MSSEKFVHEWIGTWNSRNLKRILSHYSDDIEITTPMISMATGNDKSTLKGREAVAAYWAECVSVYYRSVMDLIAIETMWFDENGRVCCMNASYRKKTDD